MLKEALGAAWVEINLSALAYNIKQIKKACGNSKIIAVVKADAYGHGIVPVSRAMLSHGITSLGVSTLHEAITLRNASINCEIIFLGIVPDLYADTLIEYNITAVVPSYENAEAFSKAATVAGKTIEIFAELDTGMGRLGFQPTEESLNQVVKITKLPGLKVLGLFSHLSTAEEDDATFLKDQLAKFNSFYESLQHRGVHLEMRTLANSAGMYQHPETHFEAVRVGMLFYGYWDYGVDYMPVQPVMTVKANIVFLKAVPSGFSIGYNRGYITKRESLIATLQIGFADGYPRLCGGKNEKGPRVIVRGCYAPIVGKVCMDMCMVDVTDVPGVELGDEVIVMGRQGNLEIHPGEIGILAGSNFDVVMCSFSMRLPKVYVGEAR